MFYKKNKNCIQTRISLPGDVTAIVLTFNEEININYCLKSLSDCCKEIFVIDSGSSDMTIDIVRKYTNNIFTHKFEGFTTQWAWAIKNLPIKTEWILALDADLVLSHIAKKKITKILHEQNPHINGYYFKHKIIFRGKSVRGLKNNVIHLFRREKVSLDLSDEHRWVVEGKSKSLHDAIIYENNHKEDDIDFWIDKHQYYASRLATEEIIKTNKFLESTINPKLFGDPSERLMWFKQMWFRLPLYFRPVIYFIYRYIIRLGFLDGKEGFVFHFLQSFWFRILVDIKLSDLKQKLKKGDLSSDQLINSFNKRR